MRHFIRAPRVLYQSAFRVARDRDDIANLRQRSPVHFYSIAIAESFRRGSSRHAAGSDRTLIALRGNVSIMLPAGIYLSSLSHLLHPLSRRRSTVILQPSDRTERVTSLFSPQHPPTGATNPRRRSGTASVPRETERERALWENGSEIRNTGTFPIVFCFPPVHRPGLTSLDKRAKLR